MPDTYAELVDALESADSQSSLMKKASPDLRRRLIEALTCDQRRSYREVFERFELDARDISFTAFYYWAHKIRRSAHLVEMARACPPDENPAELLPRIIGYRLLDAALDPDLDVKALDTLSGNFQKAGLDRERTAILRERTVATRERTASQERMAQQRVAAMKERTAAMERIAEQKVAAQERMAEKKSAAQERIADKRIDPLKERTAALKEIAEKRNETSLEIARLQAAASLERAKHRPNHPRYDEDDPSAPWGRKKDGTPVTHDEVRASLNEAIRDIYGLPPISGKSYMPDELQKMHERYPDDPRYWSPAQRRRKNNPTPPPAADSPNPAAPEAPPPDESNPSKQMNPLNDSPAEIKPARRDGPASADWWSDLKRSSNAWELM